MLHGAPFHPLGVEHALGDCDLNHGEDGRKNVFGFFSDGVTRLDELLPVLVARELPQKDHDTRGYPDFISWPDAPRSAMHQMQYYKWIERAYMAGLRLLVQHATTQESLCKIVTGLGFNPKRYDCGDMVAVDRIIEAAYALERYVDALSGGPGRGWVSHRVQPGASPGRDQRPASWRWCWVLRPPTCLTAFWCPLASSVNVPRTM